MQKTHLIFFLILFSISERSIGQPTIKEIPIENLSINQVKKILHHNDEPNQGSEWIHADCISNYLTTDTLILFDINQFFCPENGCYRDYWRLEPHENWLNIEKGAYLCIEPTEGGSTTLNWLEIKSIHSIIYFVVLDSAHNPIDKFQLLKVEFADVGSSIKTYRLTLLRVRA